MQKDLLDREHGLQELAKAYLAVRDGKAGCVMIVVEEDSLNVQTCNVSPAEAIRVTAKAIDIISNEVFQALTNMGVK